MRVTLAEVEDLQHFLFVVGLGVDFGEVVVSEERLFDHISEVYIVL